jgi:ubiquinol-cytochrome c reductase cytochrome b subunit
VLGNLFDWLDHRTGYRKFRDAMLLEHVPGGARWRYVWGSCLAFVFLIQVVTGILLMTAYSPSESSAWGSVYYIQYEMDFGWLIRGLHHFGSQTMVVLLAVHMLQVVIAGAQLPPREFNWWIGLMLMMVILGLSLTGYLLPWDQKGFWATRVATGIAGNTPLIGPDLQKVVVGGPEYGHQTLTHFYSLHVGVLPPVLVLLLVLHIAVFRRHGVTAPAVPEVPPGQPEPKPSALLPILRDFVLGTALFFVCHLFHVPVVTSILMGSLFGFFAISRMFTKSRATVHFWPSQVFRDLVACLWIFAIMASLVLDGSHGNKQDIPVPAKGEEPSLYERWAKAGREGLGANLDAPADLDTQEYPARPEWYFLFLFQLLKYFKGEQEIIGTFIIPNVVLVLLFLLPLFGYGKWRKFGHFLGIVVVVGLLLSVSALTILALADDSPTPLPIGGGGSAEAQKFQERFEKASAEARRAVNLARQGIPEEGAKYLLRNDPRTKGPHLFKANCASCHAFDDSVMNKLYPDLAKAKFSASDLSGFGSEEWISSMLDNPADPRYFGLTKLKGMQSWKKGVLEKWQELEKADPEKAKVEIAKQKETFTLIARFLSQQRLPKALRDAKLEEEGRAAFEGKKLGNCAKCHSLDEEEVVNEGSGPNLANYGSAEWLRLMIMNPGDSKRYGQHHENTEDVKFKMPPFRNREGPGSDVDKQEFKVLQKTDSGRVMHLSDLDRELIIRWMTGDGRAVFGARPAGAAPSKNP